MDPIQNALMGAPPSGIVMPNQAPNMAPMGVMPAPVPGQQNFGMAQNAPAPVMPMQPPMMARGGVLERSAGGFNVAKSPHVAMPWEAKGELRQMHVGPILSAVPGRTDNHMARVPSGSYVLPATHIASMGHGNSVAGLAAAASMFGGGGPYGAGSMRMARGPGAPRLREDGGDVGSDRDDMVDVNLSGGEYVIPPEAIVQRFGSLENGHRALDKWVLDTRKKEIQTQKKLPPPAK